MTNRFEQVDDPADDDAVGHIVSRCNDPDSGGRMIDNILTNTLLPELSREFLNRSLEGEMLTSVRVGTAHGRFAYEFGDTARKTGGPEVLGLREPIIPSSHGSTGEASENALAAEP